MLRKWHLVASWIDWDLVSVFQTKFRPKIHIVDQWIVTLFVPQLQPPSLPPRAIPEEETARELRHVTLNTPLLFVERQGFGARVHVFLTAFKPLGFKESW